MHIVSQIATIVLMLQVAGDMTENTIGHNLWQSGQQKNRGKTSWQMPVINIAMPQLEQIGILPLRNEFGVFQYYVLEVVDEWTVLVGATIPRASTLGDITSSTTGSVQSTRGNLVKPAAGTPAR